jgi:hypothetical protein
MDTFAGALILAAPHPVALFNVSPGFSTASLRSTYRILRARKKFRTEARPLKDDEILALAVNLFR